MLKVNRKITYGKNARESPIPRISFPNAWMTEMGITPDQNEVVLEFNENKIIIYKEN